MADSTASERRRRPEQAGRGTLRDEQRRLTRRRLAEAALELFEEVGYAPATADGIAKRAGANRATFYLHYAGKADVVLELMDGITTTSSRPSHPSARSRIRPRTTSGVARGGLSFFWDQPGPRRCAPPGDPRRAERRAAMVEGLEQMVDAMPRLWEHLSGEERDVRSPALSKLVGLERMYWFHRLGDAPVDRPRLLDAMTEEWRAVVDRAQTPRGLGP